MCYIKVDHGPFGATIPRCERIYGPGIVNRHLDRAVEDLLNPTRPAAAEINIVEAGGKTFKICNGKEWLLVLVPGSDPYWQEIKNP